MDNWLPAGVCAGSWLAHVTALCHDRQPPLQHSPVERFVSDVRLTMHTYGLPAGAALAEHVHRISVGVDDLADAAADFAEEPGFQGADEDAALDSVAVSLQDCRDSRALALRSARHHIVNCLPMDDA